MIDEGRLTAEEGASHRQRSMLLLAVDGRPELSPDIRLCEAQPGDRYLLCTDGLSAVVPEPAVRDVLGTSAEPALAASNLIALANQAGGPDNITSAVADVSITA